MPVPPDVPSTVLEEVFVRLVVFDVSAAWLAPAKEPLNSILKSKLDMLSSYIEYVPSGSVALPAFTSILPAPTVDSASRADLIVAALAL